MGPHKHTRILWYSEEFIKSPNNDSSTTVLTVHLLYLVLPKSGFVDYGQTSPLWSCLSEGHCSRGLVVCLDGALQTLSVLPCSLLSPGNPSKHVQSFSNCIIMNFNL